MVGTEFVDPKAQKDCIGSLPASGEIAEKVQKLCFSNGLIVEEIIRQDSILPEEGLGWEKTFELARKKILPNLLRTPSTDYMAHLHGPSLVETLAAEQIISNFNQSMDSWDQSPVATEIEVEVINHLCNLYGYSKEADGIFTSGGSQSNQTAIILAPTGSAMKSSNMT